MDTPEVEITRVIKDLTEGTKEEQEHALMTYFLPDAYFVHPFCRVQSMKSRTIKLPFVHQPWTINSRYFLWLVYQWYHILSPKIKLEVDSTAFDKRNNLLYANIRQTFTLWIVPFSLWEANVKLVCLLELAQLPEDHDGQPVINAGAHTNGTANLPIKYFIKGQQDHYQVNEFLKFIAPFGAASVWYAWQIFATFICAVGVYCLWPITTIYETCVRRPSKQKRH
ncbi:hypothetical protein GGR57DRAFT_435818 [Xylariaceae sp. FL1272]|nr:hypothetical protein GGR57DRAFT_435818 [Xylariaceae sp. FL1272]